MPTQESTQIDQDVLTQHDQITAQRVGEPVPGGHRRGRYTIAAMRRWSELAERVAATTRTSEKTALLAEYLEGLGPEELPIAAVFLTGRPFPEADQRAAGLGWAAIAATVTQLA